MRCKYSVFELFCFRIIVGEEAFKSLEKKRFCYQENVDLIAVNSSIVVSFLYVYFLATFSLDFIQEIFWLKIIRQIFDSVFTKR